MDIVHLPRRNSSRAPGLPSAKSSPEMLAELSAMVSRLLNHYWTGDDPAAVRKAQIADWLEDLREFSLAIVANAIREWRRTETRRPTIADIRKLCCATAFAERERRLLRSPEARHAYARSLGYASEDERLAAIAADVRRRQERDHAG